MGLVHYVGKDLEEIELLKLQEIDNILKCSPEAIKKSKELLRVFRDKNQRIFLN